MIVRRSLVLAPLLVLSFSADALAQYCPSYPGDYQLNFDPPAKKMVVCKYGDSMRDVCATDTGSNCSSQPAGTVTYDPVSKRLRFCNGTTWQAMTCGTIEPCTSPAGMTTSDEIYAKYCDGTNWQALHLTGACAGIGLIEGKLIPTAETLGDQMIGFAITGYTNGMAASGDYLFVGMTGATINRFRDGAIAVYKRSGANWNFLKLLSGMMTSGGTNYGRAITADGEWMAAQDIANVYIYRRDEGGPDNWGLVATKTGFSGQSDAITIRGDVLFVGSPGLNYDVTYTGQGRAYIYRRDAGGANKWGQVAVLQNPDAPILKSPRFGSRAAIDGDFVAISAPEWDGEKDDAGAVYLFQRTGLDSWAYVKRLLRPDAPTAAGDNYGASLDLHDIDGDGLADSLVIGAPNVDKAGSNVGRIYIYARNEGGADNWGLIKETSGSFTAASSALGNPVAMNSTGDTIITGLPYRNGWTGAVAVYERDRGGANNWGEAPLLTAGDATTYDSFGAPLIFDGNYIMSAASYAENTPYPGAVYVFAKSGGSWSETYKVTTPESGFTYSPRLGISLAISGEYAAIGMDYYTTSGTSRQSGEGAINLYKRDISGNWSLHKTIQASQKYSGANFGRTIDMTPDYMLASSPGASPAGWLFGRNEGGPGNWGQIKRLNTPTTVANLGSDQGLAINGATAVMGAYTANLPTPCAPYCDQGGEAYVFEKDYGGVNNWGNSKKLVPSVHQYLGRFGMSADIQGDLIVIGAQTENANGAASGAVYMFSRNQGGADNWGEVKRLPGLQSGENFGNDLSLSNETLAIGAPLNSSIRSRAGAVYIYERDQSNADNWDLSKTIYNPTTLTNAAFGRSVDLSGDTLIVGAPEDDTYATNAGRIYIFKRNQGGANNWGLVNIIAGDDPIAEAQFGSVVAIDGTVLGAASPHIDGPTGNDSGGAFLFGCP